MKQNYLNNKQFDIEVGEYSTPIKNTRKHCLMAKVNADLQDTSKSKEYIEEKQLLTKKLKSIQRISTIYAVVITIVILLMFLGIVGGANSGLEWAYLLSLILCVLPFMLLLRIIKNTKTKIRLNANLHWLAAVRKELTNTTIWKNENLENEIAEVEKQIKNDKLNLKFTEYAMD